MIQIYLNIVLIAFLLFCSCQPVSKEGISEHKGKLYIVTTTGMIMDGVRNIAGDKAEVISLMGPGIDPHYYKATQSDLVKFRNADMVFYNGLKLEGKMTDIFEKLAQEKLVCAVADGIDKSLIRKDPESPEVPDPHVWFDVSIWASCINHAASFLMEADPDNSLYYKERLDNYLSELYELDSLVATEIKKIPESQRVLITTHDAFGYFGRAYGMQVEGLQGISTVSDIGLRDIKEMTELIIKQNIKAVFVESSVSDKSINSVIESCRERGHNLKLGGVLYADAMGEEGTVEGTYLGMIKANVNKIVNQLK